MFELLILAEAIALCLIGAVGFIFYEDTYGDGYDKKEASAHILLAFIVGIIAFAEMGEPSGGTVPMFVAAGAIAPMFFKKVIDKWWNE